MNLPDRWLVLTVRAPSDPAACELLAEAMLGLGGRSVLEEGDALTTYLAPPSDLTAFLDHAQQVLAAALTYDGSPELTWQWLPQRDWDQEWRRGLQPRKLTSRIVVKSTWAEWKVAPGEVVIEIDPQMAFGTGEHATTRSCLRLLDELVPEGARVLDVGSGSAVLAIAAALLGARYVLAIEADADAIPNACDNVAHHGVADRVELRHGLVTPVMMGRLGAFDLILSNILSSVLKPLLPAFQAALEPGGSLIVSGILASEADDFLEAARLAGFAVAGEEQEEEWWSAVLRASR